MVVGEACKTVAVKVRPILSKDHYEARIRVFRLYKAWIRAVPYMGNIYYNRLNRNTYITENVRRKPTPKCKYITIFDHEKCIRGVAKKFLDYVDKILKHRPTKTEKQVCDKIKEEFVKQKHVTDLRVIDILVAKGQMELQEIVLIFQTESHFMRHWLESVEPKPNDFLSKFIRGPD